jgi:GLPGLI family protein
MKLTKKIAPIFLIILPFLLLNAQNKVGMMIVDYQYQNDFFSHVENLIVNDSNAVYIRPSLNIKNENKKPVEKTEGNWVLPIEEIKTSSVALFYNKKDNRLYEYTVNLKNKRFIVNDSSFHIEWKVDKAITKKIDKYLCYKATTNFRGRSFTAFFTPEIPISFGPFKFHNLPGLIVRLENNENDISHIWTLKALSRKNSNSVMPQINDLDAPTINAYQMNKMNKKIREEKSRRFSSRNPKGVTHTKTEIKNLGIEKIYEWELNNEQQ